MGDSVGMNDPGYEPIRKLRGERQPEKADSRRQQPSPGPTIGRRGLGWAALFSARSGRVTAKAVRQFREVLPKARVFVCQDVAQLRRQVHELAADPPAVLFCGGGDGAATLFYNALAEETAFPPALGLLRLGTGNGWARSSGALPYERTLRLLAKQQGPLPTRAQALLRVEGTACTFAGVGWDARILNDYQRELDRQSARVFVSAWSRRLHSGLRGYLYSVARHTVPGAWAEARRGPPAATLEAIEGPGFVRGAAGQIVAVPQAQLYAGPVGVAGFSTIAQYGYGLRAFPLTDAMPEYVNVRVYGGSVLSAVRHAMQIWRGTSSLPALHDCFITRGRFHASRPLPFQIAGDPRGDRAEVELALAERGAIVVDWRAALRRTPRGELPARSLPRRAA
jgi:hypothetical protein